MTLRLKDEMERHGVRCCPNSTVHSIRPAESVRRPRRTLPPPPHHPRAVRRRQHPSMTCEHPLLWAQGREKVLVTSSGEEFSVDQVLMAIGRQPALGGLDLSDSVARDKHGHIAVDSKQRTSLEGVHAVGDVTGRVELTPMAIAAGGWALLSPTLHTPPPLTATPPPGRRLADRLYGGMPDAEADYEDVPSVVFSHPPLASVRSHGRKCAPSLPHIHTPLLTCAPVAHAAQVGASEEAAVQQHGADQVRVYRSSFVGMDFALQGQAEKKTRVRACVGEGSGPGGSRAVAADPGGAPAWRAQTFMKMVCAGPERRVVGLHMLGPHVDEMLQGFAVAVKVGAAPPLTPPCARCGAAPTSPRPLPALRARWVRLRRTLTARWRSIPPPPRKW